MITSFKHKGHKQLFDTGRSKQVPADFSARLVRQLDALEQADEPRQLNFPGYDLHELKGERAGTWSRKVNKTWRLSFRFEGGNAVDVDLEDYH